MPWSPFSFRRSGNPDSKTEASYPNTEYAKCAMKIGLQVIKDVSDVMPGPAKVSINVVDRIVTIAETIKSNEEDCSHLVDRVLRVGLVMKAAVEEEVKKAGSISDDLSKKVDELSTILGEIEAGLAGIRALSERRGIKRFLQRAVLHKKISEDLKTYNDKLRWAITVFQVDVDLDGAIERARMAHDLEDIKKAVLEAADRSRLDVLPRAKHAKHDAHRMDTLGCCLDGTRVALLEDIYSWADRDDEETPRILWLNGLAGTGKSTLAYTLAEYAKNNGTLGATFFFSRDGESELHNAALVFPTLVHQLAQHSDEIGKGVAEALKYNPDLAYASLKIQWEELVAKPARQIKRPKRVALVVLDALDECDEAGSTDILESILADSGQNSLPIKFFIASRPEAHIRSVFQSTQGTGDQKYVMLHNVDDSIVSNDIRLYLETSLSTIPSALNLTLPHNWVTQSELDKLAAMAGTLFIVAATMVRFIGDRRVLSPQEQLDIILGASSSTSAQPYATLDALYLRILHNSISSSNEALIVGRLQTVLGAILGVSWWLSLQTIEKLAELPPGSARVALEHLHSVLLVNDWTVHIHHPSFPDFLRDPQRCTDHRFYIDAELAQTRMGLWCLRSMNKTLAGGRDAPWSWNKRRDGTLERLNETYPEEFQRASSFFCEGTCAAWLEDARFQEQFYVFVDKSFGPWLDYLIYRRSFDFHTRRRGPLAQARILTKYRSTGVAMWADRVGMSTNEDKTSQLLRHCAKFLERHEEEMAFCYREIRDLWNEERRRMRAANLLSRHGDSLLDGPEEQ